MVKRTEDDIWAVSHDDRSISVYSTEEQALAAAFALATELKRQGIEVVVVITRER